MNRTADVRNIAAARPGARRLEWPSSGSRAGSSWRPTPCRVSWRRQRKCCNRDSVAAGRGRNGRELQRQRFGDRCEWRQRNGHLELVEQRTDDQQIGWAIRILARFGFTTGEAGADVPGLEVASHRAPDAVLLDIDSVGAGSLSGKPTIECNENHSHSWSSRLVGWEIGCGSASSGTNPTTRRARKPTTVRRGVACHEPGSRH
jgi:hypothetical protein